MITVSNADNALKSFYLDAVTEALNYKANPFLAQLEKTSTNVVGKDVKKLINASPMGGVSAGSETGDLPKSHEAEHILFTAPLKNLYGTIEISDKALRASASNEGAFVNLLNDEMQSLIKSASYNFSRMIYGDGNGYLATFDGEIDGNVVHVNNVSGIYRGLYVDFYNADGEIESEVSNIMVTHVDYINRIVTFDTAKNLATVLPSDARIYIHGVYGKELTGLKAIFEGEELYGVEKMDSPALLPYVQTSVGEITGTKIQTAIDSIEEASGCPVNFIICSWGVRRALIEQFNKNSVHVSSMECAGGFKALSFNGIPVIADRFCPEGTMYLLNTDDFKIHQLCDWKWLEGEDGKILKQVPGKPVYTATLVKYAELMCERPCGQGMLTGITEA